MRADIVPRRHEVFEETYVISHQVVLFQLHTLSEILSRGNHLQINYQVRDSALSDGVFFEERGHRVRLQRLEVCRANFSGGLL